MGGGADLSWEPKARAALLHGRWGEGLTFRRCSTGSYRPVETIGMLSVNSGADPEFLQFSIPAYST
jgi:hypothetical protein